MGVVLAAYDPTLERNVALKLLHVAAPGGAEGRERLLREARAMARIQHPNVLTVHEVGTVQDEIFIAMELAANGTMRDWLEAEPRSWNTVVERFIYAGRGLHAAHEQGLIHRDFKPDNLLLTSDGFVRVADFGLVGVSAVVGTEQTTLQSGSVLATNLTSTGEIMGTPIYMSPEQHRAQRVDAASDQFSFCVALFEALVGEPPFHGDTYLELRSAVFAGAFSVPENSAAPRGILRILHRGLSVDPAARWLSMAELLRALENELAAERGAPSDPGIRERVEHLRARLDEVETVAAQGDYRLAMKLAGATARDAAALDYAPIRAEALYWLASMQDDAGDLVSAEKTFREAAVEAGRAQDDNLAAKIWGDLLTTVGYRDSRSDDAMLLRPAVEAALARCGDDRAAESRFLNSLGTVHFERGAYDKALACFARATESAATPTERGNAYNNVGYVAIRLGDLERARESLERAKACWRDVYPEDHPHMAFWHNNRGELLQALGDVDAAVGHLQRALEIRESSLGPDHAHTALSTHNLGVAQLATGQIDLARKTLEHAIDLRRRTLRPAHPDLAESLLALARLHLQAGDRGPALELGQEALATLEQALGTAHPRSRAAATLLHSLAAP
jgi:tetratricopeptide (TPR) repeat protein